MRIRGALAQPTTEDGDVSIYWAAWSRGTRAQRKVRKYYASASSCSRMIAMSGRSAPSVVEIPAKAKAVGRLVVLPLNKKLRTAVVEPEDLVVQVQAGNDCRPALPEPVAALRVNLEVRV